MKNTPRIARTVAAAAMSGLFAGSGALMMGCQHDHDQAGVKVDRVPAAHDCKGMNACKGQGGCKTGNNGCKGQNSCKGSGGCKVAA